MIKKDGTITEILGVKVFSRSEVELLSQVNIWLGKSVARSGPKLLFTPNSEMVVAAVEDDGFKKVLNQSDINIPDGAGVVLGNWLIKRLSSGEVDQKISSWLPGVDIAERLVSLVAKKKGKVFLLGGWPGVAQAAAERLMKKYPGVIALHYMGRQNFDGADWNDAESIKRINVSAADLLLVAYGPGKQEKWLMAHKSELKVKVAMGVGGSFDFWAGRVRRAPRWVNRMALEWLWRLIMEPWRVRRQLKLFKFWGLVVGEALDGKR